MPVPVNRGERDLSAKMQVDQKYERTRERKGERRISARTVCIMGIVHERSAQGITGSGDGMPIGIVLDL
jgi:hypothetical protein